MHVIFQSWISLSDENTPRESEVQKVITGPEMCVEQQGAQTHTHTHSKSRHCAAVASDTYIQTHHVTGIQGATMPQSILPVRLAPRHKLNTHYVVFTSSDIQHHTGLLLKLIDQIHSRLPNIRKQSQYKTPADSRCHCVHHS